VSIGCVRVNIGWNWRMQIGGQWEIDERYEVRVRTRDIEWYRNRWKRSGEERMHVHGVK